MDDIVSSLEIIQLELKILINDAVEIDEDDEDIQFLRDALTYIESYMEAKEEAR